MTATRPILMLVAAVSTAWLVGCGATTPPPPAPPEVTVAVPEKRNVTIHREFTGNVDAMEAVEVRARVQGFLETKDFQDGTIVEEGKQLFLIEPEPYEQERDRLKAEVNAKKVELEQEQFDLEKTEELAAEAAATAKQLNDARIAVARAEAALAGAEASYKNAELNLTYTKVLSPITGRVGRNRIDVGNLVGAGENTLLTTVVLRAPVHVYFEIDERTLVQALGEQSVEQRFTARENRKPFFVSLPGESDFAYEGELDFIDNVVDASTGTIKVRGVIANESKLFIPGQFVRVRVPIVEKIDAVLVEEQAVGTDLGGKFVLVVNAENVVEHHPVVLGQLEGDMRVIEEGIEHGEQYIVAGLQRARPGRPVTISTKAATPATAAEGQGD